MRAWLRSYRLLLLWGILRIRRELPPLLIIQSVISLGVVVGFSFLIPNAGRKTALYLCTGGMTVALITAAMVMAPQIVSYSKKAGFLDYQRSMPVPRTALMASDATIWAALAIPGILLAMLVAALRFGLTFSISPLVVPAILLVVACSVGIGYTVAYALRAELVGIVTNAIIVMALMFAPVNYPAEQLPHWLASVHQWLPFQYMAQAIRETVAVPPGGVSALPFVVLTAWAVLGVAVTSRTMTRCG